MATTASRKTWAVMDNLDNILAIEYLCASQALDLLRPLKPSPAAAAARKLLRKYVATIDDDRWFGPDIEKARELIASGRVDQVSAKACNYEWELL